LGDGVATIFAGFIGAPANTTYSENTGVLAVTKNYNPVTLEIAAVFAILLSLFGKFGAILQTIPTAVMGGVSIILFGIIASTGMRTLAEAELDFAHSRNLVVIALILSLGIGISTVGGIPVGGVTLSGLFIAAVVGIVANLILPEDI
jgi:uracil permease